MKWRALRISKRVATRLRLQLESFLALHHGDTSRNGSKSRADHARRLKRLGLLIESDAILSKALEQCPNSVALRCQYGENAVAAKDWPEALRRLEPLVDDPGTPPDTIALIAQVRRRMGDLEGAERLLSAHRADAKSLRLMEEHGELAVAMCNLAEALSIFERIEARYGEQTSPLTLYRLAHCNRGLGKIEAAEAYVSRGLIRFPDDERLAMEQAEIAQARGDWTKAASLWKSVIDRFDSKSWRPFVRLSMAHRELGEFEAAEQCLRSAARVLGDSEPQILVEKAELARCRADTATAERILQQVLGEHSAHAPVRAYVRLSHIKRGARRFREAKRIIELGEAVFPGSIDLAGEQIELAMAEGRHKEVVERASAILDSNELTKPKIFIRLAQATRALGDVKAALQALQMGLERFPEHPDILAECAEFAMHRREWSTAVEYWERTLKDAASTPRHYVRLSHAFRIQGDHESALNVVNRGLERFGSVVNLLSGAAEIEMSRGNWHEATRYWQRVAGMVRAEQQISRQLDSASFQRRRALPTKSSLRDWFECDWSRLAEWLLEYSESQTFLDPESLLEIVDVLRRCGTVDVAFRVAEFGRRRFPECLELQSTTADLALDLGKLQESLDGWKRVLELEDSESDQRSRQRRFAAAFALDRALEARSEIEKTLRADALDNARSFSCPTQEVPNALRVVFYPRESTIEDQLRAANFFDRDDISRRLDEFDDVGALRAHKSMRFLKSIGWRMARKYATQFARPPELPSETLQLAIYFHMVTELGALIPVRHLARRLHEGLGSEPVFIDLRSTRLTCLRYWGTNDLEPLFLAHELRRRGANAFLCVARAEPFEEPPSPDLVFSLEGSWERLARAPLLGRTHAGRAIVPSGIRGIDKVVQEQPATAYSASHVIQTRPYSSRNQRVAIEYARSLYPFAFRAATLRIPLQPEAPLKARTRAGAPAFAQLYSTGFSDLNLFYGLQRLIGDALETMSRAAEHDVDALEIREAHICDHIFLESALVSTAVKRRGGRVVLWPHSTNPVDVQRHGDEVSRIIALTETSRQRWQAAYPKVQVELRSELMLPAPSRAAVDPSSPVHVIVLGGGSMMARMPVLPLRQHRDSYRRLFLALSGIEGLKLLFKPKGEFLESPNWLYGILRDSVRYELAFDHPLDLDYPNMVMISVSYGSSALLEAAGRGIPGFVVRDFPVEDYSTLDPTVFPAAPAEEIAKMVGDCCDPKRRAEWAAKQLEYYRAETGFTDSSDSK